MQTCQIICVFHLKNLTIVKLGGSVITYKDISPPQINKEALSRISRELKSHSGALIVVLGGGSYGHQAAHTYGFGDTSTSPEKRLKGIPAIRHNMSLLSLNVESALRNEKIPAVVLPPFAFVRLDNGKIHDFTLEIIQNGLETGQIVIIHGDVCFDISLGASILSGDTIAVHLAKELDAKALYIGTDVDGVFDGNPKEHSNAHIITLIDQSNKEYALSATNSSMATDVTGGMRKKIEELLNLAISDITIAIFNLSIPKRLAHLLEGKSITCTRIKA